MPISFKSLFRAVGCSEAEAETLAEQIDEQGVSIIYCRLYEGVCPVQTGNATHAVRALL